MAEARGGVGPRLAPPGGVENRRLRAPASVSETANRARPDRIQPDKPDRTGPDRLERPDWPEREKKKRSAWMPGIETGNVGTRKLIANTHVL